MESPPVVVPEKPRSIWARGLYMILFSIAFHLSGTILGAIAFVQFVVCAISGTPLPALAGFGRNLGAYLQQVSTFMSFSNDSLPFPFSDWPSQR